MNVHDILVETSLVSLGRAYHPQDTPHCDPEEETFPVWSANFPESGEYGVRVGKEKLLVSPGSVFLTCPRRVYRFEHLEEVPSDVSFSVVYSAAFMVDSEGLVDQFGHGKAVVQRVTNRQAWLQMRLKQVYLCGDSPLSIETLAGELLTTLCQDQSTGPTRVFKEHQLTWYARRVEEIKDLLEVEFNQEHSLHSLSRRAGMSPWHFARVFRELTGVPPHRHLMNVRLEQASLLLLAGASVTEACFAVGFINLSHFTRTFQRKFSVLPSKFTGVRF